MASVTVLNGNTITDIVLNGTGMLGNWGDFLDANSFDTWTPDLVNGQQVAIPANAIYNNLNVADLADYPANNFSALNVYQQIADLFILFEGAVSGNAPAIEKSVIDTNVYYVIPPHSTISDAVLNSTGNIINWDSILEANFWDSWTPNLAAGEAIKIPKNTVNSLNNFRALNQYPANNFSVSDIDRQIIDIFDLISNPTEDWILAINRGFWADAGYWRDGAVWID